MSKEHVFIPISTVGGATITVGTAGHIFGGFSLNGSGGGTTITIINGTATIMSTSAGANALISVTCPPLAFPIVATCSGTGFYSLYVSSN